MARTLQISGMLALGLACAVFTLCVREWHRPDSRLEEVQGYPSVVEKFKELDGPAASLPGAISPLVAQAEALATYLNPPKEQEKLPLPGTTASSGQPVPPIRLVAPSVKFRLHGTSYYPNQPDRSMALIGELGAGEGSERWVKEGARLGHFVIHEIRRGAIVYCDGEDLREMAVERSVSLPSLVRDLRPGSLKVSAAMDGGGPILPAPAGPNGVETAGGN